MIAYYRSRSLSQPVVYVEQDDSWKYYGPGGVILETEGPFPDDLRQDSDPVPLAEVIDLLRAYEREAAERDGKADQAPPVSGLGGWLILPIIGLYGTALWSLYYVVKDLPPLWSNWGALTSPESSSYHPLFGPYIAYTSFVGFLSLVAPIFLLWLIHTKKRVLPTIIVCVYAFFLFVMVVDFVALETFISQFMAERGMADEASSLVSQGVAGIVRGILACGIWIPYFLFSRRVRNTFTQPWSRDPSSRSEDRKRRSAIAALAAESRGETAADVQPTASALETAQGPPYYFPRQAQPTRPRKILMIPVLAVLVIVIAVVAGMAAWRSANPPVVKNPVTVSTDISGNRSKHYSNADFSFSFNYPADWRLEDGAEATAADEWIVSVHDPWGETVDGLAADSALIGAVKLAAPGETTLADMRDALEQGFEEGAAAEGLEPVAPFSETTVNGLPAVTAIYRTVAGGESTVNVPIYYVLGGDCLYYITFNYTDRPTDTAKVKLDAILRSFQAEP